MDYNFKYENFDSSRKQVYFLIFKLIGLCQRGKEINRDKETRNLENKEKVEKLE